MMYFLFFTVFLFSGVQAKSTPLDSTNIPAVSGKYDNGYPKDQFLKVLTIVAETYQPIIENLGGHLKIYHDWTDGAVNMWAGRTGSEYWLEIPGGLARYYLITEEAFVLSICHELGHLLGGAPQNGDISFEGQADYFATQNCHSTLLASLTPLKDPDISNEVETICRHESTTDKLICHRSLEGARSLSSLYAEINGTPKPSLKTPSRVIAKSTYSHHPPAQCRLDTFLRGYFGSPRPKCWFR